MEKADRLTVIGIGVGIILAIITGACSTNARIADLRSDMNARFGDLRADMNARFGDLRSDMNAQFAEAAEESREDHRRIDERLDRLEDILLKPAPQNAD